MKSLSWTALCLIALLNFSCSGESGFSGSSKKAASGGVVFPETSEPLISEGDAEAVADANAAEAEIGDILDGEVADVAEIAEDVTLTVDVADETAALNECLKSWPDQKFTPEQIAATQTFQIDENVQNNSVVFSDSTDSPAAQIKLVVFNIKNGNQSEIELLDNNGFYCVYFKSKIVNNFRIVQECDARLATVSQTAQNMNNFMVDEVCE